MDSDALPVSRPLASLCRLWQCRDGKQSLIQEEMLVSLQAREPTGAGNRGLWKWGVCASTRRAAGLKPQSVHVKCISE